MSATAVLVVAFVFEASETRAVNCPRCMISLSDSTPDASMPAIHAAKCSRCAGMWMTQRDLHRLEEAVNVSWIELRHLPGPEIQAELLTCPVCIPARHLNKVRNERDRKVVLDVCNHCHGVWVDRGELEAIQEMGLLAALVDAVRFFLKRR